MIAQLIGLIKSKQDEIAHQAMDVAITEEGQLRRTYMAGKYAGLRDALEAIESMLEQEEVTHGKSSQGRRRL